MVFVIRLPVTGIAPFAWRERDMRTLDLPGDDKLTHFKTDLQCPCFGEFYRTDTERL